MPGIGPVSGKVCGGHTPGHTTIAVSSGHTQEYINKMRECFNERLLSSDAQG